MARNVDFAPHGRLEPWRACSRRAPVSRPASDRHVHNASVEPPIRIRPPVTSHTLNRTHPARVRHYRTTCYQHPRIWIPRVMAQSVRFSRQRCLGTLSPGAWMVRTADSPYVLSNYTWHRIGLNWQRDHPLSDGSYGLCDIKARRAGHPRVLYDWVPRHCRSIELTAEHFCASRAFVGQQVLFVGDSTTGQLFMSFVMLINGTFGRNAVNLRNLNELTASACNDSVRLNYVRNNLCLWSARHRVSTSDSCGALSDGKFQVRASEDAGPSTRPAIAAVPGQQRARPTIAAAPPCRCARSRCRAAPCLPDGEDASVQPALWICTLHGEPESHPHRNAAKGQACRRRGCHSARSWVLRTHSTDHAA
jgi:hypothetical protein